MRTALFISHANPEDNAFVMWLGAKLAALGYDVWADILKLRGGQDWQRRLEEVLRHEARKVLVVATPDGVKKQGLRNEVQIAHNVGQAIHDNEFIIPLRLAKFEEPFLIAHLQYIDFSKGWDRGFKELVDTLDVTYAVPRSPDCRTDLWREVQLRHSAKVVPETEMLVSNWVSIARFPDFIKRYDFGAGISIGHSQSRIRNSTFPVVPYWRGFLSLANIDELQAGFGPDLPLVLVDEIRTTQFLADGWPKHNIPHYAARRQFVDLARQGLDHFFQGRSLARYFMANNQSSWWMPVGVRAEGAVAFNWGGQNVGRRQIVGYSNKRKLYWHFGVSAALRFQPVNHLRFASRLIFSEDGHVPIYNVKRMHRLRRSFAKSWRNARWRDMLLAFLYCLADGKELIRVPMGEHEYMALLLPPMSFRSGVSVLGSDSQSLIEEDDPDIDDVEAGEFEDESELVED